MAIEQKRSVGSESSITSIASESIRECSLNENHETTADVSGVPSKVRKPYTISKQREKWTEDEHQRFIEAIKLYGRSWRQIEEYISTKSAVQIRSHAQKFFSKVMKEGPCSAEASIEPIEIPPPRPKRKPLHPYPRKQPLALVEDGTSGNMKISDREVHSPISVLSPEGSQISALHANKGQGSGSGSRTSSDSNLYHVVEKNTLIKDSSTTETKNKNEEDLSLTLHFSGTSPDDSILMCAGKTLMELDIKSSTDEDNYSDNRIKGVGVSSVKSIKLFGRTVAVPEQSEYSDSDNINNILMGKRKMATEKGSSKSFSCTGSNSETNLESVDSKMESNQQQANANSDKFKKGFYPYKRCLSDQEAVYTLDARERQRIRVYL